MPITTPVRRRTALGTAASLGLLSFSSMLPGASATEPGLQFGPPEPFSFEGLIEHARQLAARPYVGPASEQDDVLMGWTPPTASMCQSRDGDDTTQGGVRDRG